MILFFLLMPLVVVGYPVAPWNVSHPGATCQITPGQDCYGSDISARGAANAQACCDFCASTPGCKAFTQSQYDQSGQPNPTCYMKSGCPSTTPAPTCSAGTLNTSPTPPPAPTPPPPPTPVPPPCSSPVISGTLAISYNGSPKYVYVVNKGGSGVNVDGSKLTIDYGPRVYLGKSCDQSMNGDMFWSPNLLGKNVSYTVNLAGAGCGCNIAFYLVSMPARNGDGSPNPTKCGDYYCDANLVCGVGCPEFDIMEANNAADHVTPHKCDGNSPNYYNCDGGGCVKAIDYNQFGPGKGTIDTNKDFKVQIGFAKGGSGLDHVTTILTQEGRSMSVYHNDCGGGYLQSMGNSLAQGMTFTISSWGDKGSGGDMQWLDVPPCNPGTGCNGGSATFSDIKIW